MNEQNTLPASSTETPAPMAFRMLGAVHSLEARLEAVLAPAGLSLAKFGVLSKLAAAGEPVALGCLAGLCSCVRSNMTQLIDRLEAEKLVERVADPSDRRSVKAALTAEGRARHAEGAEILDRAEREVFAFLGEEDRATLSRLLRLLESGG